MRSEKRSWMKRLLAAVGISLLALHVAACKKAPASEAIEPPKQLESLQARLGAGGIKVTELESLRNLRELPECAEAEFRWRLYFESRDSFVNVSRFRAAEEADACERDFRQMALKGGANAWERLRRDIAVRGHWLLLFPPSQPSEALRRAIVEAVELQAGG